MMSNTTSKYYAAHWSGFLVFLTVLQTLVCLIAAFFTLRRGESWVSFGLLVLILGCALFSIRGYTVTPDAVLIHRLFWATRLPLADLQSANRRVAHPWQGIRIGNGGFFSFTGWRYSPGDGFYRVFVTDPHHLVALQFPGRKVVVSPSPPEDFILNLPIPSDAG